MNRSGQGRDRTGDTRIFSPVLYQLSYLAKLAARWKGGSRAGRENDGWSQSCQGSDRRCRETVSQGVSVSRTWRKAGGSTARLRHCRAIHHYSGLACDDRS